MAGKSISWGFSTLQYSEEERRKSISGFIVSFAYIYITGMHRVMEIVIMLYFQTFPIDLIKHFTIEIYHHIYRYTDRDIGRQEHDLNGNPGRHHLCLHSVTV